MGSRDGVVVRALASHQCGPGSIPRLSVTCGLSLLWVLVFAPRGLSPGSLVFPLLKNQHFQILIWSGLLSSTLSWAYGLGRLRKHSPCYWHYIWIYFIILFFASLLHTYILNCFLPKGLFRNNHASREIDHNTGNYVPYSLRTVSGFFNVP